MRPRVLRIFNVVATINFVSFWIVAALIGDAINGHMEGGRFFLKNHSGLNEVSHAVYIYSWLHALSVIVTVLLAMVVNAIWGRGREGNQSGRSSR
jgi:hypothetical protein